MIIKEKAMLKMLDNAKSVLLVEPNYKRKHAPIALAKIKTYLEAQGKTVDYARGILAKKYDLICVTTLFTYYSKHVFNILKYRGLFNTDTPILVGGVMASLMPEKFKSFKNVYVFTGYSKELDLCVPHRSLIDMVEPPFNDFSYINTSRGCVNKCIAGDTIINTIEGDIPIKDLVGREIGVYTYDRKKQKVLISKAINIREMGMKELVRVHFDDETFIDCTKDHRFLTFKNGNQYGPTKELVKEAQHLCVKDSVRAMKKYETDEYINIHWGRGKTKGEHRLVMEYKLQRKLLSTEIVHHRDEIKSNNEPENLKLYQSIKEHFKDHPEISERMKTDNPQKYCTKDSFKKMGEANKGIKRSIETRRKLRESKLGKNNPNYKDGKNSGLKSRIPGENHKVVFVEYLTVKEMTYDMEVPETHWFFANNVLLHNCSYCAVWRIEKPIWVNPEWEKHLLLDKPNILITDNNISSISYEHLKSIIDVAVKHDKKLFFQNGLDCKYIDKKIANQLARVQYVPTGLRTAFDRIEEDGVFQVAIEHLIKAGVPPSKIEAYILFNFTDKPHDADYRARTCADFKITPYPQFYTELNAMSKKEKYVGKYWTLRLATTFRFFWLLRGHFNKYTFEEFLKLKRTRIHFKLTEKDIETWNTNGGT